MCLSVVTKATTKLNVHYVSVLFWGTVPFPSPLSWEVSVARDKRILMAWHLI